MRINYNVTAYRALNSLNNNDNNVSVSLQKLSSGLQVVGAKENPAGLAMSKRMNMQIEGVKQANNNTSDGISIAETADGALTEVHDMLQRINELAIKANSATWLDEDRKMMDDEAQQLMSEIERIAKDTEFNGQPLLNGNWDLKGYVNNSTEVKVATYSDDVVTGTYILPDSLPTVEFDKDGNISNANKDSDIFSSAKKLVGLPLKVASPGEGLRSLDDCVITDVVGNRLKISDGKNVEVQLEIKRPVALPTASDSDLVSLESLEIELKGLGAMTLQTGANEHQVLDFRIQELSLQNMGLATGSDKKYRENLLTMDAADSLLKKIGGAIQFVSDIRSRIGAYQNRLEHTVNNLDVTEENMTSAYSRIMDVDMAEEMTNYTSQQVLSQAATSMLAQANQRPSEVLQLLQ
ncbi:MAG: flagellin [Lachnospiraceae bacterium]|nr:flagellin [Lachnospiraceae bacterium]